MRRQACRIVVAPSAWATATTAASRHSGRETGGVLVGWRHSAGVCVTEFIEVSDRRSTRSSYLRRHSAAAQHLESVIGDLPEGSPEGYVGEWHTHPEPQDPSPTDRGQLKQISKKRSADIALIVVVYDPAVARWEPRGLCARSGKAHPAVIEVRPLAELRTTRSEEHQ